MIGNLKLKVRPSKEEAVPSRRIKTEINENAKKISFYMNKTKAPLAENKKIVNDADSLALKKHRPIKSIALKQPNTKLNTEARDNDRLTHAHRQAIDKIFAPTKKDNSVSATSHSLHKR